MTEEKKPQGAQKVQEAQKAQEPKPARKARKKPAAAAAQKEQKATKRSRARKAKEEPHEPGRELTRGEQLLIIAAANKSGRDAAKVELPEALAIMGIEPADSSEPGIAAAVEQYWQNISIGQLEEMLTAGRDDKLFKTWLLAYIGEAEQTPEHLLDSIAAISARNADRQTSFAGLYAESQRTLLKIAEALQKAADIKTIDPEARKSLAVLTQQVQEAVQAYSEIDIAGHLQNLFQNLQIFGEATGKVDLEQLQSNLEAAQALFPYFEKAFKEARADPETADKYAGITAKQIFDLLILAPDGVEAPEQYAPLLERAWQLKAEADERKNLPQITYRNSKQLKSVTDKLMNVFFSLAAPADALNGQRKMIPLKYESRKSKKEITLVYDFQYNETELEKIGIPKGFGGYEWFVATILDNLYENGNSVVSYSKILEEMGETGRPGGAQFEKLAKALVKGATTTIHINDLEVQKAWGNDTGRYTEIVGQVFPITIKNERYIATGLIADGAIRINEYSPFRALAGTLGHLTQWDKKILRLYTGRKTDRYWRTLQLLMREIGWMRNDKSKRRKKILYSTLYSWNGDDTARDKQLTRTMLYRLLEEVFKKSGYIITYKEDSSTNPGVVLEINPQQLLSE